MSDEKLENIRILQKKTGCGLSQCRKALELCEDINSAYKYLELKSIAVCRYKIVDNKKIPWTEDDYVECAKRTSHKERN